MKQVRLPTSKLALLLLGLCFQQEGGAQLEQSGEWVVHRWRGPRGGTAMISVRTEEADLVAILQRVVSTPLAYVELAALLVALALHGGVEGAWAYERAAELLHGPRTAKSHRGREVPPLRDWLRLMAEGYWRIDLEEAGSARKGRRRAEAAPRLQIDGPLLTIEGRTVRPVTELATGLRSALFVMVPASIFLVSRLGHHNPHGNLPSVAAKARMRIAAAIAARWRQGNGQRMRPEELFEQWAGLNLAPVRRRRRIRSWTRALEAELQPAPDQGGPGLGPDTEWDELRPLRSLLRLVVAGPTSETATPHTATSKAGARGPSG